MLLALLGCSSGAKVLNSYVDLSLTADAQTLIAVQAETLAFREPSPALFFLHELLSAQRSERVETGLPIFLSLPPLSPNPALLLHVMKSRVKGALFDTQQLGRNTPDMSRDGVPMHTPAGGQSP
jgi:hypothetical protein